MYHLARRWLSPSDSLFAAVFYALNPYHLLIIYWRSAYAELLTAALLPLLLLLLLRLKEPGSPPHFAVGPALWRCLAYECSRLGDDPLLRRRNLLATRRSR